MKLQLFSLVIAAAASGGLLLARYQGSVGDFSMTGSDADVRLIRLS